MDISAITRQLGNFRISLLIAGTVLGVPVACTPTVQVAAPTEPITINLNVRIEHEVRVRVDRELDDIFSEDSDLF
ncbi:MAG TPA: YnbE family lipoprotein [Pseudohongiella sp.]|nr:YnbE family lipoprotein [Pseudohongiella sp.]|tara:strand:- start:945 stop:1169 length:225 start_codon:yes stop_codon:yes gene_type:complete